jgi:hypothetical protein
MTYFITALTNDRARLIAKEARVTCAETAKLIEDRWTAEGFIVVRREEN